MVQPIWSPRLPQTEDFYDESGHLSFRARESEMNRSNRGKLEFISGGLGPGSRSLASYPCYFSLDFENLWFITHELDEGIGAVKSIFSRLTSKDRDFPEARDSVTEMEDIKKKASSFRTSMSKPETEIRVNRNVKWINTVARCLGKFSEWFLKIF